jgi:hypothetical protein
MAVLRARTVEFMSEVPKWQRQRNVTWARCHSVSRHSDTAGPATDSAYAMPDGHFGIGHLGDDIGAGDGGIGFAPARALGAGLKEPRRCANPSTARSSARRPSRFRTKPRQTLTLRRQKDKVGPPPGCLAPSLTAMGKGAAAVPAKVGYCCSNEVAFEGGELDRRHFRST